MVESVKGSPTKKKSKTTPPAEIHKSKKWGLHPLVTPPTKPPVISTTDSPPKIHPTIHQTHQPASHAHWVDVLVLNPLAPYGRWPHGKLVETRAIRVSFFDEQLAGCVIITWEIFFKKLEKPGITNKQYLYTCHCLGLIFSCNKVIMVDPVFYSVFCRRNIRVLVVN